jgi:hypothetical protein
MKGMVFCLVREELENQVVGYSGSRGVYLLQKVTLLQLIVVLLELVMNPQGNWEETGVLRQRWK